MNEDLLNKFPIKSSDNINRKQKKIIKNKEYNNSINLNINNQEINNLNTIPNINRIVNTEGSESNINEEDAIILDNKKKYNTIDNNEIIQNDENKNSQKKKVEKKVNRNLKLLKIIKERMKEQKYKNMFEEEEKKRNKNIKIEENLNDNNQEINQDIQDNKDNQDIQDNKDIKDMKDREEEGDKQDKEIKKGKLNKNEEKKENEKNNKDEEKKNILLNIINSKKYNKFQRIEKNNNKNEISEIPKNNKEKSFNKKILKPLIINNPITKENQKETDNKDSMKQKLNERSKNDNVINNIKAKYIPLENKEKKERSFSKKDSMKILELLKSKKKEQKNVTITKLEESKNKNINDEEIKKHNVKSIDAYTYKSKRKVEKEKFRNNEIVKSLPRKSFREEEDEDDYHNKTQEQFSTYKAINEKKINQKENDININNKVTNYFNHNNKLNTNKNNYINNNNSFQYYTKINKINYNPISINNNKFQDKLQNFYTIGNENSASFKINNYDSQNLNNKNLKTLENNSPDIKTEKKNLLIKRIFNKSLMNSKIYKPKRISNNNSPKRKIQYERNTINAENMLNNIKNNTHKNLNNQKISKSYIKKSPEKYKKRNDSLNNNTIDNERNLYNKKTKRLLGNYKKRDFFNTSYNNIGFNPINHKLNTNNNNIDEFRTNRIDSSNNNNNYNKNSYDIKNIKKSISKKIQKQNSMMFNLEDLMILEERLNDITLALESNENIDNNCFNFWNYYFNCSLYNLLEKIFQNKEDSNIVRLSINYKLISIMVCYEYSFEIEQADEEIYLLLLELIELNHNNLIIICEYVLTKIMPENKQNIWVLKLQDIIKISNSSLKNKKYYKNSYLQTPIEKINYNINLIIKTLKNILLNFPTQNSDILITLLKKIDTKTYEEINDFFREFIIRFDNFEGSIIASSYLKKNKNFKPLPAPYLISPPSKNYTLVLDLDETLVHFKIKSSKGGTLRARPYLFGFLEEMGHYYELVIWTSATESYANSLIDAIEYEKKYFDYILYREHAIIIGDDFVKDLTRIGRGLDRIIIIDDMPQNYRLQKENGITIKPFLGDDYEDSALYELVPILKHIAEDGIDTRIGLKRYREEILKKITSNISKQDIY